MNTGIYNLFGYIVRCNGVIHNSQMQIIEKLMPKEDKQAILNNIYNIILEREDKVGTDFETAVGLLNRESYKIKEKICLGLIKAACFDGKFDDSERSFLKDVFGNDFSDEFIDKTVRNYIEEFNLFINKTSVFKRIKAFFTGILYYFLYFLSCLGVKVSYEQYRPKSDMKILQNETYSAALKIKDEFDGFNEWLVNEWYADHSEQFVSLENKRLNYSYSDEAKDIVSAGLNAFEKYNSYLRINACRLPTVALVGETKAGKSTLFYILTGTGKRFIGKGDQRTTRYSTEAIVDGIRIIDTPGIDAAVKASAEDERKAMTSVKEADAVYFITASDRKSEAVQEFYKNVLASKPTSVVINYINGYTLSHEKTIKDFFKKPKEWIGTNSENRLEGFKETLEAKAEENGLIGKSNYFYVFLYAAAKGVEAIENKNIGFFKKRLKFFKMNSNKTNPKFVFTPKGGKALIKNSGFPELKAHIFSETFQNFYLMRLNNYFNQAKDAVSLIEEDVNEKKNAVDAEIRGIENYIALKCSDIDRIKKEVEEKYFSGFEIRFNDNYGEASIRDAVEKMKDLKKEADNFIIGIGEEELNELSAIMNYEVKRDLETAVGYDMYKKIYSPIEKKTNLADFNNIDYDVKAENVGTIDLVKELAFQAGLEASSFIPGVGVITSAASMVVDIGGGFFSTLINRKNKKIKAYTKALNDKINKKNGLKDVYINIFTQIIDKKFEKMKNSFVFEKEKEIENLHIFSDSLEEVLTEKEALLDRISELNEELR